MKVTAERTGVPIVQLAQARRGDRNREIQLEDIGLSYAMVQDSDKVFLLTRQRGNVLRIKAGKIRLGKDGWSFYIDTDHDIGKFNEIDEGRASSHAFF